MRIVLKNKFVYDNNNNGLYFKNDKTLVVIILMYSDL